MSDLPTFTPEPPPQTEQRPKRGPRKKKAEAVKPPKRKYVRVKNKDPNWPAPALAPLIDPVAAVLAWWDILIQLDAASRKKVLEKILA